VLALLQNGNIKIFAVTEDNKGMAADLYMSAIPGSGKVAFITSNSLVGKDTQTTGNIALSISQKLTNTKVTDFDIIFDIRANASEVDGPSAGAAMTLLAFSMLSERKLNPVVALTGTINSDGSVGMVGGVGPKSQAASKAGVKLFMIPLGEAVADLEENGSMKTVNLLEYGPNTLGMKVVEVSTINQAIEFAYADISVIKVDSNITVQTFIPKSIAYDASLIPMKKISQNYISEAKVLIDEASSALEKSDLSDELRADLYNKRGEIKKSVEMSQRFLDQNYLYSAANYAFNARVMAGCIKEIAQNPSLLSSDSILLDSKISSLRKDISDLKGRMNFVSIDGFEWVIGAQQRVAYAENALNVIESTLVISIPSEGGSANDKRVAEQQIYFKRIYDYESAVAWVSVSKDFLKYAQTINSRRVPLYTTDFRENIKSKLVEVGKLINDTNISKSGVEEALRRYNASKVSYDNNFLFAALYDAYFAESFIMGEANRNFLTSDQLYAQVGSDINAGSKTDSIWANMFFDHAKFYYENAEFNKNIGRTDEMTQSLMTSYDLIFLNKKLTEAKGIVKSYISQTAMQDYTEVSTLVDITYTKREDPAQYVIVLLMALAILLVALVLMIGLVSKSRRAQLTYDGRKSKVKLVLGNLDKALSSKKISDAEYFFMKKKYEEELNQRPATSVERKRLNLSMDDLRAKQKALERGLMDLQRHYKSKLLIPEDYEKNSKQVREEIIEVKAEIRALQEEKREKRREQSPLSLIVRRFTNQGSEIRGTEEQVDFEKKQESSEKNKRKKLLKKFAFKEKK